MSSNKMAIESGQRAVALLSLYLESEMQDRPISEFEVAVALSADNDGRVPNQVDLITALVGINIALLYSADPENPRKVLQLVAEAYNDWDAEEPA